ncbi:SulP family inorganic anion transporter [Rivibacter subsaxonicus]|uniref:High affinity sulfate transporter 1 n=1 Tax=Rivibacter subsaxonicus TaxID=457575 RepID=A0A4Q7W1A1_9BURK|nr:SulP family inorganic anion transporter [Rivibacter subsaxonicus]RZU02615.1 high affinity sulfate transporter 1 [Rivibacter subsaxonicus]
MPAGSVRADLVAGITLAAYLLPAGLGDASLANLPPEAGLYACLFSGLLFWLFCGSRHTAITVTSAISILVGTSLGTLAEGDASRFGALAAATALIVALLAFLAWWVRAGALVNFISETVMIGFKTGVALFIASTQLPKLFGFGGGHGSFWERIGSFFSHLGQTNPTALAMGVAALALLLAGKRWLPNRPVALVVVVAGVVAAGLIDAGAHGVKLLGAIPQGLPPIGLPAVHWSDLNELLPLAVACFMLAAVETVAIGRTFALKHGYRLDANQEFLGLAAANLGAGLGQGFAVAGGMSQSLVNESGGARTPLSGLVAALIVLVVVLFFSDLLRNLPQPVLAAIVLVAVAGLFKLEDMLRLWRVDRGEFLIAVAALAGVLGSGLLRGVMIGALISLVILLRRASTPHVAVLGRVPGTDLFGDVEANPENERIAGVFVFRPDASLLYFNCEFQRERFLELLAQEPAPVKLAIWSLSTGGVVDLAGAETLLHLRGELARRNIEFMLADIHGPVRANLRAAGLEAHFGSFEANASVATILRARGL